MFQPNLILDEDGMKKHRKQVTSAVLNTMVSSDRQDVHRCASARISRSTTGRQACKVGSPANQTMSA